MFLKFKLSIVFQISANINEVENYIEEFITAAGTLRPKTIIYFRFIVLRSLSV